MPFINYGDDDDDGVVARLSIEMPDDSDQAISNLKSSISDIRTELEASNRFLKDFMDHLQKAPEIAKITAEFQEQEISHLQKKLDLERQIADVQKSGRSSRGRRSSSVQTDSRGNLTVDNEGEFDRRDEENRQTQDQFRNFSGSLPAGEYPQFSGSLPPLEEYPRFSGGLPTGEYPQFSGNQFTGEYPGFSGNQLRHSEFIPPSRRIQNMMEYRQRIGERLQDPLDLFNYLRERGFVSEGISGGEPTYTVQLGNRRISAEDLINDPNLQSAALDHLATQSAPGSSDSFTHKARNFNNAIINAIRGFHPGASPTQTAHGISGLLNSLGLTSKSGGLTSLGKGLLIGGGAIGLGAGALEAIEEGGEAYQNIKNLGQTHNQGFSGGLGYEMGMRMMALNPFITTDQARQIMMNGLNLGYTGKEFDTVTNFMAENLKSMNLQVADSVKLLQTNVQQGNQSIGGLSSQLNLLQQLSGNSIQTNTQAQQKFIQTSQQLVNQGVTGEVSGAMAIQLGQWFQQKDSNGQIDPLAQFGGQITNQALASPQFQQQMIALGLVPPNTLPQEAIQASGNNLPQNIQSVFQFYANQAATAGVHAPVVFQQMMAAAGIQMGLSEATQLYGRMRGPASDLPVQQANKATALAQSTQVNPTGGLSPQPNPIFDTGPGTIWDAFKNPTQQRQESDAQTAATGKYSNPILNQLVQQYGAGDLVVYDPQGNPHQIDYNNKDMMYGIGNGSWKIAFARTEAEKKAMEGNMQQWAAGARALGAAGNEGTLNQWANNEVQTYQGGAGGVIGLTPDAQKLIYFLPNQGYVPNDPGTLAANAGINGAQPNNNPFTPYGR